MTEVPLEATPEEVRRICGEISDAAVAAIVGLGASVADLEAAVVGDEERMVAPASEVVVTIQEVLAQERGWEDEA
jgi:hypothetical protein